jgi:hypothetical protein
MIMKLKNLTRITTSLCIAIVSIFSGALNAQEKSAPNPTVLAESEDTEEVSATELTEAADRAIEKGFAYLIASQKPNGSWTSDVGPYNNNTYDIGGTSLGLMAFMVKGHFPGFGRYGPQLNKAKDYLLTKAKESTSGVVGGMYEHGLFTLALSELWGMTHDVEDNKVIQEALEKAVAVILRAQSPLGGWRYSARPDGGQDTSATATVFVALASAQQAGIFVPTETIDRVVGYLREQVWNESTGGFGYQGKTGTYFSATACGAYAAQLCGKRDTEWVGAAIRYLEKSPKVFSIQEIGSYYYAHYYAITAMVQAGGDHYAKWYPQIRDSLIQLQQPNGSWIEKANIAYPSNTPMAIIILGTPHCYIPIYQR